MSTSSEMLTTQQFAEKASVSTSTVSKWLREGKIEGVKEGRKWMIPPEELSKATDTQQATPRKEKAAAPKTDSKKGYSIEQFSELTYLTPLGVERYLKEGRLSGTRESSGKWVIDAANLEKSDIKRLVR